MSTPAPAISSAEQPQCQFFVLRKKRLCRMTVRPGRQYCGEHEPQPPADLLEADKRIPCPNDPKHTCYASKLEKHLAKCNARQTEDPPYIVHNINAPEDEDQCPRIPLKDVPTHTLSLVIDKINQLYDKHVLGTISSWAAPPSHHPAVEASIQQADRGDSSRRHLRQASRLMQLAEERSLVQDNTCYVELGAGKGMLSYYMGVWWCAGTRSRVVVVDRAALRHKRDNLLPAGAASRLRADLRHLDLHRTDAVQRAHAVVGLAKHLCGVATDYALRCVSGAGVVHKTRGVVLATCCHHRCQPAPYVGTSKLKELGITSEELNIMFGIVSWATCGDGRSRDSRALAQRDCLLGQGGGTGGELEPTLSTHTDKQTHIDTDNGNQAGHAIDVQVKIKKQKLSEERNVNIKENEHVDNTTTSVDNTTTSVDNTTTSVDNTTQDADSKNKSDPNPNTKETAISTIETEVNNISNGSNRDVQESKRKSCDTLIVPLDIKRREEVGRRAKALLDHGRVLYLRDLGFEASLCYYVPATESLENVCIVAKKPVSSAGV